MEKHCPVACDLILEYPQNRILILLRITSDNENRYIRARLCVCIRHAPGAESSHSQVRSHRSRSAFVNLSVLLAAYDACCAVQASVCVPIADLSPIPNERTFDRSKLLRRKCVVYWNSGPGLFKVYIILCAVFVVLYRNRSRPFAFFFYTQSHARWIWFLNWTDECGITYITSRNNQVLWNFLRNHR